MRGKEDSLAILSPVNGITPAYAGKSEIMPCFKYGIKDHPRLCGEKAHLGVSAFVCDGSPPPMRGKEVPKIPQTQRKRITPAYAGKSNN